jgi:hypothetical protein
LRAKALATASAHNGIFFRNDSFPSLRAGDILAFSMTKTPVHHPVFRAEHKAAGSEIWFENFDRWAGAPPRQISWFLSEQRVISPV